MKDTGSDNQVMVECINSLEEETAVHLVGACSVMPYQTCNSSRRQVLKQVTQQVGPVCNDPPGSGDRPFDVYLQRGKLTYNNSSGIPDDMVETPLLVLGGAALPDWKWEAQHAFYDIPVELYEDFIS